MITAIIPAAGRSERMGKLGNKLFVEIKNKPILAYTLEVFNQCPQIDQITLVLNEKDLKLFQEKIEKKYHFKKNLLVVKGGKQRQDSVFEGLKKIDKSTLYIVIHDGSRPLITTRLINKAISDVQGTNGIVLGLPLVDTIKKVSENRIIEKTLNREKIWLTQTPQIFKKEIIIEAHQRAKKDKFQATDDAMLVERLGYKVKMLPGSSDNIKITNPEDLRLMEYILDKRKSASFK